MTPIAELPFRLGSPAEWSGYQRWRDNYSRRWNQAFDPIGLQLHVTDSELRADLGVMPVANSFLTQFATAIIGDAALSPIEQDNINEPLYFRMPLIDGFGKRVVSSLVTDGASATWMGDWIAWSYDPSIQEDKDEPNLWPPDTDFSGLTFYLPVRNVAAMERSIQEWFLDWFDQADEEKSVFEFEGTTYYRTYGSLLQRDVFVAVGNPVIIAMSESSLQKALQQSRGKQNPAADLIGKSEEHWSPVSELGKSAYFRLTQAGLKSAWHTLLRTDDPYGLRPAAWKHLPILNHWRQLQPDSDPVTVHEERLGIHLRGPDGSGYRWNEAAQTMESIQFGHPGEYPDHAVHPPMTEMIQSVEFGLTLEHGGLRAKTIIR
jgi:hypothetical protein